ncbi:unnamed protein product [Paramecium sonneborni]|uniref:Uncharacterized protein n=1 Tax=Paramecium sonneborni TaxID=65129 RepID=A0A8S1MY29_9CILI|nr:unnamed protein product [Paramecium sonneborni]
MSQLQIYKLRVSNETKSAIKKSILKSPQQCLNLINIRLDQVGNQIIKGELNIIQFLNKIDTAGKFLDILSNETNICINKIEQDEQKDLKEIKLKNNTKNQCEQIFQSNFLFYLMIYFKPLKNYCIQEIKLKNIINNFGNVKDFQDFYKKIKNYNIQS